MIRSHLDRLPSELAPTYEQLDRPMLERNPNPEKIVLQRRSSKHKLDLLYLALLLRPG